MRTLENGTKNLKKGKNNKSLKLPPATGVFYSSAVTAKKCFSKSVALKRVVFYESLPA